MTSKIPYIAFRMGLRKSLMHFLMYKNYEDFIVYSGLFRIGFRKSWEFEDESECQLPGVTCLMNVRQLSVVLKKTVFEN